MCRHGEKAAGKKEKGLKEEGATNPVIGEIPIDKIIKLHIGCSPRQGSEHSGAFHSPICIPETHRVYAEGSSWPPRQVNKVSERRRKDRDRERERFFCFLAHSSQTLSSSLQLTSSHLAEWTRQGGPHCRGHGRNAATVPGLKSILHCMSHAAELERGVHWFST